MAFALAASSGVSSAVSRRGPGARRAATVEAFSGFTAVPSSRSSLISSGKTCLCGPACACACPCHGARASGRTAVVPRAAATEAVVVKDENDLPAR